MRSLNTYGASGRPGRAAHVSAQYRLPGLLALLRWLALGGLALALLAGCGMSAGRRNATPATPTTSPPRLPTLLASTVAGAANEVGQFSAINPVTGAVRWSQTSAPYLAAPVVGDGAVYVTLPVVSATPVGSAPPGATSPPISFTENLKALRISDGGALWTAH